MTRPLTRDRAVAALRPVVDRLVGVERMHAEIALTWLDERLADHERAKRSEADTKEVPIDERPVL